VKDNLIFATNNPSKLAEVMDMLSDNYILTGLSDINCSEDVAETADTLEGNALIKARYVKDHYGYDCFADDTGLEVEALDGEPGVYSARYAGPAHDSQANIRKLLQALEGETNRKARFRTVIALALKGKEYVFEGIIEGNITESPRGNNGFGYDPVFVPDGFTKTFAELSDQEKNAISHRAKAVHQLAWFLSSHTFEI
jgi:XTP/dITP diphosphohydrolase